MPRRLTASAWRPQHSCSPLPLLLNRSDCWPPRMDDNAVQGLSHPLHRQCGFASTSDLIYRVNLACHSRKHPQYLYALWSRREVSVPHGRSRLRSESILVPHRYCLSCFISSLFTSRTSYSRILILSSSTFLLFFPFFPFFPLFSQSFSVVAISQINWKQRYRRRHCWAGS